MPKDQVTCRDCPCCESMPGSRIGLCWRPYPGPQVVDVTTTGWCGDELMGDISEGLTPRELWVSYHGHGRERLAEVGTILSLASVGSRTGAVGTAVEKLLLALRRQGCNLTCAHGGYPDCEQEAGLACGTMLRAREIWAVICLLRGEVKA